MSLRIIGTGFGRTGTYSLKAALEQLNLGPCYHMEHVLQNMPTHVPLWNSTIDGDVNTEKLFEGMLSAVDWPSASFYQEL